MNRENRILGSRGPRVEAPRSEAADTLSPSASADKRFWLFYSLSVAVVAAIGLLHLPYPFMGDQALFLIGAEEMAEGKVLYRDVWDLKLPGIFYFYFVSGKLFGFGEVGVHLLELIVHVSLCIAMGFALRGFFRRSWTAALVPLLSVGVFYASSTEWHLTQIEILTSLPIFLGMGCMTLARRGGRWRPLLLVASGFMAGLVAATKLLFVPILGVVWLYEIGRTLRERRPGGVKQAASDIALLALVPALISNGLLLYFGINDALESFLWSTVDYPALALAEAPMEIGDLMTGLKWFEAVAGPNLFLALWAFGGGVSARDEPYLAHFSLWLIVGFLVVLFQVPGWTYEYHYLVLFVPAGILAAKGVDCIAAIFEGWSGSVGPRRAGALAACSFAMLYSPALLELTGKAKDFAVSGFGLTPEARWEYQTARYPTYARIGAEVSFLMEPGSAEGPIHAFNPLFYHLSGRRPATRFHAWTPYVSYEMWLNMRDGIAESRPPYVFLDAAETRLKGGEGKRILELIGREYRKLRESERGVWYVRRDLTESPD